MCQWSWRFCDATSSSVAATTACKVARAAEAALLGFAWLVIPFLPASGVSDATPHKVLKTIGVSASRNTFSRETYVHALYWYYSNTYFTANFVGFCILAALVLHLCLTSVPPSRGAAMASRAVYWMLVVTAVVACVYRSRERNMDWFNDESLFRSSLLVCPRSAKLQLQVIDSCHINS